MLKRPNGATVQGDREEVRVAAAHCARCHRGRLEEEARIGSKVCEGRRAREECTGLQLEVMAKEEIAMEAGRASG